MLPLSNMYEDNFFNLTTAIQIRMIDTFELYQFLTNDKQHVGYHN